MKKENVKIGMYVDFKADWEQTGKVLTKPDRNGYVDIEGSDTEKGPEEFNIHYSRLEKTNG